MTNAAPGWYDDGAGRQRWWDGQAWTDQYQDSPAAPAGILDQIKADAAAGSVPRPGAAGQAYVVLQVILKEKLWGSGSGNLTELEGVINKQAAMGYRLHTITTAASGSKGIVTGGDRIQATMIFERI